MAIIIIVILIQSPEHWFLGVSETIVGSLGWVAILTLFSPSHV